MKKSILILIVVLGSYASILAQPFTKKYILSYHVCDAACTGFNMHMTHLAESNDGSTWTEVPNFVPYLGSVPDVVIRGSKLYIYNPGKVKRYDHATNTWDATTSNVTIVDSVGASVQFVDPSAMVDANGNLVLFFLNSTGIAMGQDPAGCGTSYPCTKYFDSAVEIAGSDGTQFLKTDGHRLAVTLNNSPQTASDPDIFFDGTNYIMYVSKGSSTLVYSSATLHGTYAAIAGLSGAQLTNQGGIPCGFYDSVTAKYWTYVHANASGSTVIRQAIHADFSAALTTFNTVMSGPILGQPTTTKTESPGFCENNFTTSYVSLINSDGIALAYPNPMQRDGFMTIHEPQWQGRTLEMHDLQGKVLLHQNIEAEDTKIAATNFPLGLCFYRIFGGQAAPKYGKLIVQ